MLASLMIFLFISCEKSPILIEHSNDLDNYSNAELNGLSAHKNVPFTANFFSIRNYSNSGEGYCDATSDLPAFNFQKGDRCGNATHMGLISTEMYFCGAIGPGPDGIPYSNGVGYLEAANGDRLNFEIPADGQLGYVVFLAPGSDPIYDAYFQTPFKIVGGTGRFINATGGGMTNSYVNIFDENGYISEHQTDHVWTGTISY